MGASSPQALNRSRADFVNNRRHRGPIEKVRTDLLHVPCFLPFDPPPFSKASALFALSIIRYDFTYSRLLLTPAAVFAATGNHSPPDGGVATCCVAHRKPERNSGSHRPSRTACGQCAFVYSPLPKRHGNDRLRFLQPFVEKLWDILQRPEHDHLCRFSQSGTLIILYTSPPFAAEILNPYFHLTNVSSFIRQLNVGSFLIMNILPVL
jgi:HSF-type DNA-binding